ncbi:hypothetical protein KAX35_09535 [candidate division WOR-3 bacterium]|nr:hypothetical protein [candidate division WOR-3 bacterium]
MNKPATTQGNWLWRLSPDEITLSLKLKLREMTEIYGRKRGQATFPPFS